jgi:hypothetical protein
MVTSGVRLPPSIQQVGNQDAIDRHACDVALDEGHVGHVHPAKHTVAEHPLFECYGPLASLFAIFVWRRSDVSERGATDLSRCKEDITEIDVDELRSPPSYPTP